MAAIARAISGSVLALAAAVGAAAQGESRTWPEGSAMHTGGIYAQKQAYFEKLLAKRHAELVGRVAKGREFPDARLAKALVAQQTAWLKYREAECELVGSLSGAGGTWPSTYAVQCQANLTDLRFRTVSAAIRCIDRLPGEEREFGQSRCLYQLGPLTFGRHADAPAAR